MLHINMATVLWKHENICANQRLTQTLIQIKNQTITLKLAANSNCLTMMYIDNISHCH